MRGIPLLCILLEAESKELQYDFNGVSNPRL
jgi:hypothetical protein